MPDYESHAPSTTSDGSSRRIPPPSSSVPVFMTLSNGDRHAIVVKLPPRWKVAKDELGRPYYYNTETKESQWDPPACDDDENDGDVEMTEARLSDGQQAEYETASTASEGSDGGEDGDDTDDEDDEEEDEAEIKRRETEILSSSDLSAREKEFLLARKKTKEERQHERRQKRERDREKREYERKRRRERHGKHRKSGLVTEHFIPVRILVELIDTYSFLLSWRFITAK